MASWDKYAVVLRYMLTIAFTLLAGKLSLEPTVQADLINKIMAVGAAIAAVAPLIYALVKRPSPAAMQVAKEADKVIAGDKASAVVPTPAGAPDIKVSPAPASRGGQG